MQKKNVVIGPTHETIEDLISLTQMVEDGVIKPVVDKSYSLKKVVEAHRYVESGKKKGNVAIQIC